MFKKGLLIFVKLTAWFEMPVLSENLKGRSFTAIQVSQGFVWTWVGWINQCKDKQTEMLYKQ